MNNKDLWIQAMRDVQEQVYDLTVQRFQQIKLTVAPGPSSVEAVRSESMENINERRWIEATIGTARLAHELTLARYKELLAHELTLARYKELVTAKTAIVDKNPTSLSADEFVTNSEFIKAYDLAKKYLDDNPGKKIQAIKEIRDHFNLSLREAKDIVDLIT